MFVANVYIVMAATTAVMTSDVLMWCNVCDQELRKRLLEMQTKGHKFDPMGWPTKMLKTEPK